MNEATKKKANKAYDNMLVCARLISGIWALAKPCIGDLSPTTKHFALSQIIKTANRIAEEAEECL